jgi:hypothetical protein
MKVLYWMLQQYDTIQWQLFHARKEKKVEKYCFLGLYVKYY